MDNIHITHIVYMHSIYVIVIEQNSSTIKMIFVGLMFAAQIINYSRILQDQHINSSNSRNPRMIWKFIKISFADLTEFTGLP